MRLNSLVHFISSSIELWERFGYYGLQGIMAAYLVKMLGMSEAEAIVFAAFTALVYGFVAIGGWFEIKFRTKRVIVLGLLKAGNWLCHGCFLRS